MEQKKSNKKKTGKKNTTETPATVETGQTSPEVIQNIELSMIACNPFNPRRYRTEEDLEELKQSIINFGIIQPITLRTKDGKYEIVCGERRYRASLMAGRSTIPAIIKDYSDAEAMEITILENLQRRDISPVEEAVSFGKLMEVRGYSIDDLVKQFGKTDKYIRSRLQLRNLIDEISELVVGEEITLGVALELSRFCPDIQKNVYKEHLSGDDSYSWKRLQTKEFRRMIENGYSTDLSRYEFDKSACTGCPFNSSVYDLFADGNCGNCQNPECLRTKQADFIASETNRLLKERANIPVCIAPNSYASTKVIDKLTGMGCEIYEMPSNRLPVEPKKPLAEDFASIEEYETAENEYDSKLLQYRGHSAQIEKMVEEGTAQIVLDVSRSKPELCYRFVPGYETQPQVDEDTVEKLQEQDRRNKELAIEKGIEEVARLLKGNVIPVKDFSPREQDLFYFLMLSFLRKENYEKFGVEDVKTLTDEEKIELMAYRSIEQENALRRDFIIHFLSQTSSDCLKSKLLLEFAKIHFPDKVAQIKQQCNETYRKRHEKIEERIRELQPFNSGNVEEAVVVSEEQDGETVPAPETVETGNEETVIPETPDNEPNTEEISAYPGPPEHARIGEIPEEEEELFNLEVAVAA